MTSDSPAAEECPTLPAPPNGGVATTSGNSVGSLAIYSCDSGFSFAAGTVITRDCLGTGEWSGVEPQCVGESVVDSSCTACYVACIEKTPVVSQREPVRCPDLADPPHGAVETVGEGEGSLAMYSCDAGFVLSGEEVLVCGEDGKWNSTPPACESKSEKKSISVVAILKT